MNWANRLTLARLALTILFVFSLSSAVTNRWFSLMRSTSTAIVSTAFRSSLRSWLAGAPTPASRRADRLPHR